MNHVYRVIWSNCRKAMVAVSEISNTSGKSASGLVDKGRKSDGRSCHPWRMKVLVVAVAACFTTHHVCANPLGAQVVNGTAAIHQTGNQLTVTNSPNAIINWQSFSIGSGQTTSFIQQSAASSVLNRVVGPDPSQLLGTLTSNGRVFLINPSGILVGAGARIDVAGFVASTLNLSNADFLAGKLNFTPTLNAGNVSNQGTITTPSGGTVYLVAPQVENTGIITTPSGETILAAGNTVNIIDTGTPGVSVQITGSATNATNLGQILADSGRIGMVGAAVKNSGTLNASSLVNQGGRIFLKATQTATVDAGSSISADGATGGNISIDSGLTGTTTVAGTVSATGINNPLVGANSFAQSGNGGTVEILGNNVGLFSGANVDVSGSANGGNVFIGGNFHGAGPQHNASRVIVASGANINADGGVPDCGLRIADCGLVMPQSGSGGNVAVWSDYYTQFMGNISARGSANGGNGGFVEVSGKQSLAFHGLVDTTAAKGLMGTLLLDPTNITIAAVGPTTAVNNGLLPTATFADAVNINSTILNTDIQTQLGLSNVIIDTTSALAGAGNIIVNAGVTWANANSLTLNATVLGTIAINAPIAGTLGSLALNTAGGSVSQTAPGIITVGTLTAVTGSGLINLATAANAITNLGAITAGGLSLNNGALNISGAVNVGAGSVALTSTGTISETVATGKVTAATLTTSAVGGTTLNGANAVSNFGATDTGAVSLTNIAVTLGLNAITSAGLTVNNTGNILSTGLISSSGNINLFATGGVADDVTIGGGINYTNALITGALNIQANRNVIVQTAPIQATGAQALNVTINSDRNADNSGAVAVLTGGNILSNGGNITIGGGNGVISAGVGFAHGDNAAGGYVEGVKVLANLTAAGGNIVINGIADAITAGLGGYLMGVEISGGSIVSTTAAGTITLTGQSNTSANLGSWGVGLSQPASGAGKVTSVDGAILINGIAGSGVNNIGVDIYNSSIVQATGLGSVTINGTAGNNAAAADYSRGIDIEMGSSVLSNSGMLTLNGTTTSISAPAAGFRYGIHINGGSTVNSQTGAINLIGTGTTGSQGIILNNWAYATSGSATSTSGNILLRSLAGTGITLAGAAINTTGNVTLDAVGGGAIIQSLGSITATGLRVLGDTNATASLTSATNHVTTLVGNLLGATSSLSYADSGSFSIGSLATNDGAGVTSTNGISTASLALQYGQGAVAAGNLSNYFVNAAVNLPAGINFSTKLGSDGIAKNYTVLTALGAAGDATVAPATMTLQGMNMGLAGNYVLGANIDATATSTWNAGAGFAPVGNAATQFTGTFDGLGHTISNLTINKPASLYIGMFGVVGTASVIRNVGLVGDNIVGLQMVGALVGKNSGTVSSSYASGSVSAATQVGGLVGFNNYGTGATITNSYAMGSVTGTNTHIGGLVGYSGGGTTIINSYAAVNVSGGGTWVGGLAGVSYGTVTNNYATGSVSGTSEVGGLMGKNFGMLNTSYSTGLVSGTTNIGGLVGINAGTVTNGFWDVTTSVKANGLGIGLNGVTAGVAGTPQAGVTGLATTAFSTAASFTGFTFGTVGGTANQWVIVDANGTLNNAVAAAGATRPMLASEYSATINNAHQLQLMAMNLAGSYTLGANVDATNTNGTVYPADMWGSAGFVPVGSLTTPFTGTFDGLGHTISNLTINTPTLSNIGLFGFGSAGSAVRNVGLIGGRVKGSGYIGSLLGRNDGAVSNAYSQGVAVIGVNFVGGLVGDNGVTGTISNSYATGAVGDATGISRIGGLVGGNFGAVSNSYAMGNVTGDSVGRLGNSIGGLVGKNYGSATNTYATGSVSGFDSIGGLVGYGKNTSAISTSYATGSVIGGGGLNNGGLVGWNNGGTVGNSFWNSSVYATGIGYNLGTLTGSVAGLTTAQTKQMASFTGFSIANTGGSATTWRIYEGSTTPLLRSFLTPITLTPAYNGTAQTLINISDYAASIASPVTANILGAATGLTLTSSATAGSHTAAFTSNNFSSTQQGYDITVGTNTIAGTGSTANNIVIANALAWTGGNLTVNATNIAVNAQLAGGATSSITLNAGGTISEAVGGSITAGSLIANSIGGTTLSGTNTLGGLNVQTGGVAGTGALNVSAGTTTLTGTLAASTLGMSAGMLNINGVGPTTLASVTMTGGALNNAGVLNIGSLNVNLADGAGAILGGAGAVNLTGLGVFTKTSGGLLGATLTVDGGKILSNTATGNFTQTGFALNDDAVLSLANGSSLVNAGTWTMTNGAINFGSSLANINLNTLQRNGSATMSGNALLLTPASGGTASAYLTTPFSTSSNFESTFSFNISGGSGADGISFIMQNAGLTALGAGGGSIGVSGIVPSIAAAYRTWGYNQIDIWQNGGAIATTGGGSVSLRNQTLYSWVDYTAASSTMQIFLSAANSKPATAILTGSVNLATQLGSQMYLGFTGATGGATDNQIINNWSLTQPATGTVTNSGTMNIGTASIRGSINNSNLFNVTGTASINGTFTNSSTGTVNLAGILNAENGIANSGTINVTAASSLNATGNMVAGIINAGINTLNLNATGNMSLTGLVSAGNISMTSSGTISETGAGAISTAGTLTTSAVGGTTLNGANAVSNFGATDTGAVALTNRAVTLGLNAITSAGLTVNNTGAIAVNGAIAEGINNVALTASGAISEGIAGTITAGTLTTSAAGGTTLTGLNAVTSFGASDTGAVALTNTAVTLGLNAITSAGLTVNNTGAITINGLLNSGAGAAALTASTNLNVAAGGITSTGAVNLNFGQGGTGGTLTLVDTAPVNGLTVTATGGAGIDTLVVTSNAAATTLGAATLVGIGAGTIGLAGIEAANLTGGAAANVINASAFAGAVTINDTAGGDTITGNGLTTTLVGQNIANAWNLTGANAGNIGGVTNFTGIGNLTGGTSGNTFTLQTAGSLSGVIAGGATGTNILVDAGTVGNIWSITGANAGTVRGVAGGFSQIASLTGGAGADTFTFASPGTLSGVITGGGGADVLAGTTTGAVSFAGGSASSLTINALTSASLGVTGTASVNVAGAINSAAGAVNLASIGTISETAGGLITASTLVTSAVGGTTLNGANAVSSFSASDTGAVAFANTAATLDLNAITSASLTVNNTGTILVGGAVSSSGGDAILSASNGITQNADISAFRNVTLTANANAGAGNFIQNSGSISNTDTLNPGNITINAYDIQVGATHSRNNVLLNATHDLRILNAGLIGGGAAHNFHVDDASFAYTLPFGFTYYGVPYTTMYISSNGVITFGSGSSAYSSSTAGLMRGVQALPTISPAWSDWMTYTNPSNDIYIHQPSAGSLAVRWDVVNYGYRNYNANFETVLSQTGNITFNYGASTAMAPYYSAIIGVSKGDNLHYTISALNNPTSLNNLSSTMFNYNAATGNYVEALLGSGGNGGLVTNITAVGSVSLVATAGLMNIVNSITAASISAQSLNGISLGGLFNAGTVALTATNGVISEGAGAGITAGTLTTSAAGGTTLNGANAVSNFGASDTGAVALANTAALGLNAITSAGLTVTNTGGIAVNGAIAEGVNAAALIASGAISEGIAGTITAGTLTTSAAGGTTLNGLNALSNFGANDTGAVALANTAALGLNAITSAGLTVTNTGAIAVNGAIAEGVSNVALTASGVISEGVAGTITAGSLTTSAAGGTTLNGANRVTNFGASDTGAVALTNTAALGLNAITSAGLTVTNTGGIAVNGAIAEGVNAAALIASGAISEGAGGLITAGTLTLAATSGLGSSAAPLQLAATSLSASTSTGGGYLVNTPTGPVTLLNFTTNDASPLSYMQNGQALTLAGIMSSVGGSLLIDPPTSLTMSPTSSISSGGGVATLIASGNILLSSINAGTGAVSITTTGGMIGSSLAAGVSNVTAGSVTASAVTGAQFSFNAPVASVTSTGGSVLVSNLATGATINNAPVVTAPVVVAIQQVVTTTTVNAATTASATPGSTYNPTVTAPNVTALISTPVTPPLASLPPPGATIGGTTGTFGSPDPGVTVATSQPATGTAAASDSAGSADKGNGKDDTAAKDKKDDKKDDAKKDDTRKDDGNDKSKPGAKPEKC